MIHSVCMVQFRLQVNQVSEWTELLLKCSIFKYVQSKKQLFSWIDDDSFSKNWNSQSFNWKFMREVLCLRFGSSHMFRLTISVSSIKEDLILDGKWCFLSPHVILSFLSCAVKGSDCHTLYLFLFLFFLSNRHTVHCLTSTAPSSLGPKFHHFRDKVLKLDNCIITVQQNGTTSLPVVTKTKCTTTKEKYSSYILQQYV